MLKKNIKKVLLIGLATVMTTVVVSGCSKSATDVTESSNSGGKISKEPLELTIHMHYYNDVSFKDDWEVFKKAGDETNVYLKGTVASSVTNSDEAFNLMVARGDLPDIVHGPRTKINEYGTEGAFVPLNDMIEKYAPNIKKFMEENPDYKRHITAADGNIYGISYVYGGTVAQGYYIRQDWLDKLGLEQPKTKDEYHDVLLAFKNGDPNGNGKKDEIPYFARSSNELVRLVNLFGCHSGWYVKDGKVHYGMYDPEYKTAVTELAKWYKEGIIDPEIYTRGNKARDELLSKNLGGATHDWFGSTAGYNESLKDTVPGINFVPIAPPADINGDVWEETARAKYGEMAWGISYKNQHPVETMKYFDFWFSKEGLTLANFGIEGKHYNMVDGKPVFTDLVLKGEKDAIGVLQDAGAQIEMGTVQDFWYEEQWLTDAAKEGMEMY